MKMMLACFWLVLAVQLSPAYGFDIFGSLFNLDVLTPKCFWNEQNRVPEATPLGLKDICFDQEPLYNQAVINQALKKHPSAQDFLHSVVKMYQPMNQTYFSQGLTYNGNNFGYEDMCPVNVERVLRVNAVEPKSNRALVCNVVNPYEQNILMATCGTNCIYNGAPAPNNFCVPDGYIDRYALVYCPSSFYSCMPVKIKIPVGCSCKKYTCLKY